MIAVLVYSGSCNMLKPSCLQMEFILRDLQVQEKHKIIFQSHVLVTSPNTQLAVLKMLPLLAVSLLACHGCFIGFSVLAMLSSLKVIASAYNITDIFYPTKHRLWKSMHFSGPFLLKRIISYKNSIKYKVIRHKTGKSEEL